MLIRGMMVKDTENDCRVRDSSGSAVGAATDSPTAASRRGSHMWLPPRRPFGGVGRGGHAKKNA